jgi:hypothetical protein
MCSVRGDTGGGKTGGNSADASSTTIGGDETSDVIGRGAGDDQSWDGRINVEGGSGADDGVRVCGADDGVRVCGADDRGGDDDCWGTMDTSASSPS